MSGLFAASLLVRSAALEMHFFGDGYYYFVQTHSLLTDFDLDLRDEYRALGEPQDPELARTTRGLGNTILWAPFHASGQLIGAFSGGGAPAIMRWSGWFTGVGSTFYVLLGLVLLFGSARARELGTGTKVFLLSVTFVGCSLWVYAGFPIFQHYNHGLTFFLVALSMWLAGRPISNFRELLAGSVTIALVLTTRPEVFFLVIPLCLEIARASRRAGGFRSLALALVAFGPIVAQTLLFAWHGRSAMAGAQFLHLGEPWLLETLFGSRNGLFMHQPVAIAGAAGWLFHAIRTRDRGSIPVFFGVLAFIWVQASAWDHWGGLSIGPRRMIPLVPLFFEGLCRLAAFISSSRARAGAAATLTWAAVHAAVVLPGLRAVAIDNGVRVHVSRYEEISEYVWAAPLLAVRALQYSVSPHRAWRVGWNLVLYGDLDDAAETIDPIEHDSVRYRDLELSERSDERHKFFLLPLHRSSPCALFIIAREGSGELTVRFGGKTLGEVRRERDVRVFAVGEGPHSRWVPLEIVSARPFEIRELALATRCAAPEHHP